MIGRSALHALGVFLNLSQPQTATTKAEQDALRRYANKRSRAVEIGVAHGFNTRLIAEALRSDGTLYAVDPFFTGRIPICWGEVISRIHLRRAPSDRARVEFVRALSWEAATQIDGVFDFVFVDGDHSLEGIRRDWDDWAPRISEDGIIALHDTVERPDAPEAPRFGSHEYYESHIRHDDRFEIIEEVDTLSVLARR